MSIVESTAAWPPGTRKTVLRTIPDANNTVAMRFTNDGDNAFSNPIEPSYRIVISYYHPRKVFIVWNAAIHRFIHHHSGMTTLSAGKNAKALIDKGFDKNGIECTYKEIRQNGLVRSVEMVTVVGIDALYDFCKDYEEYLIPKANEIPKGKVCLYATLEGELLHLSNEDSKDGFKVAREREQISRAKRDRIFRGKVIDRWGGQCIICGAKEQRILEAAHKESVGAGGSDDPINGYCLCANHHRMYDSGFIDIQEEKKTFTCCNDKVKVMPWYNEAKARGFKLFLPND